MAQDNTSTNNNAGTSTNANNNNNKGPPTSTAHSTATTSASTGPTPTALNVYKKVAIIRGENDMLTYEDSEGNIKTITDLHLAAAATIPLHKPKPKDEIPVPKMKTVQTYTTDIPANYHCPTSYVRYSRLSYEELRNNLEYVVDVEDEVWLRNNTKFGGSIRTSGGNNNNNNEDSNTKQSTSQTFTSQTKPSTTTIPLPLSMFEIMLDIMEKATGFDVIITYDQAEHLILQELPQLYHMYPLKGKSGIVTIRVIIHDIYQYWVSKRSKLKRPLLRRFWPVTSTDDTNPHLVFRPREKEKYKLRKKRQNDMDAYRKLQQLKQDFTQIKLLVGYIQQREELFRSLVLLKKELFQQQIYDAVDTSGLCRISQTLDRQSLNDLLQVTKQYDVPSSDDGTSSSFRRKRGRRSVSSVTGGPQLSSSRATSRSTSPTPSDTSNLNYGLENADVGGGTMSMSNLQQRRPPSTTGIGTLTTTESTKVPMVIAGQNNGEPAPSFLQPLSTREGYTTSWERSVPHITTIVDGRPEPTFRFRHRPRIGRGGRVCIDRVPLPTDPNIPPHVYYTASSGPSISLQPKERLLDLLPPPINKDKLSRRIEEICLSALQEDYDEYTNVGQLSSSNAQTTTAGGGIADPEENDGTTVVVKMKDWLNTDDQVWGDERYAIGPM